MKSVIKSPIIKLIVVLGLGVLCSLWLTACMSPADQAYVRGEAAFQKGDYHTAFVEYQKAAPHYIPQAQYALGYMYYNGLGTKPDQAKGWKWMLKAAGAGDPKAIKAIKTLKEHAPLPPALQDMKFVS